MAGRMPQRYYSVEQVAGLLGLHVRTVRGYVRDGRLRASRVGRQYRITGEDLAAFTGAPAPTEATPGGTGGTGARRQAEVSGIVRIDAITPAEANRVSTTVLAAIHNRRGAPLRVESVYDEERAVLKVIVLGDLADTAELLRIIHALTDDENHESDEDPR
ncbi:helix-turn-helix domain-containing protein [Streptomyces xiamenensis]|uniref:MerR family transcriptional regulator n=1 Tax=Streptomyces xiamenensis TaxID=408015 RepID=A0A0F7FT31_9ACTN|nr:helix-turn-helix domain-containing protein [Streptomyces xiamenensis]AKG42853.1 MerR family transcriptional regulator [Streptomyces xiamenensis]